MSSNSTSATFMNSLVFFDLETTGLLDDSPTKITELFFCSIGRNQFVDCSKSRKVRPRVTNRLNLCINPARKIHPKAAEVSNLDDISLEKQSKFDDDVFNAIFSFLNRLEKPVCLVAHNGMNFDFPILVSEIAKLGKELPGVWCVDSLVIFKELQENPQPAIKRPLLDSSVLGCVVNTPTELLQSVSGDSVKGKPVPKRKLTQITRRKRPLPSYKLIDIYKSIYGKKQPEGLHEAEGDVNVLFKIAIATPHFLDAVDSHALPVTSIKKIW